MSFCINGGKTRINPNNKHHITMYFEIFIEIVLILIVSYFLFYKSFLNELGKQTAKLSTIKELTRSAQEIKNEFNEKLEDYRNRLNEDFASKIEPLKYQLERGNIAYQIKVGYLHQERAKVIVEMYQKLQELYSSIIDWTKGVHIIIENPEREKEQRKTRVNTAIYEFKNYYLLHKLFFKKEFCKQVDSMFKEFWDRGWNFGYIQERLNSGQLPDEITKEYIKQSAKISQEIQENFPNLMEEMEEEFRKLLGVFEEEE